jgi:hypothetical protein
MATAMGELWEGWHPAKETEMGTGECVPKNQTAAEARRRPEEARRKNAFLCFMDLGPVWGDEVSLSLTGARKKEFLACSGWEGLAV